MSHYFVHRKGGGGGGGGGGNADHMNTHTHTLHTENVTLNVLWVYAQPNILPGSEIFILHIPSI